MSQKPIFYSKKGKRWHRIKSLALFSVTTIILLIFVSLLALFGQQKDLLPKIEDDSNFDVIDNISGQDEKIIKVDGLGTLVKISPDYYSQSTKYGIKRFGETNQKIIVLSFDDGPDPEFTPQILKILKKENVPATFFLVGKQTLKHPDIAKELVQEGQEIGNHTFSHNDDSVVNYADRTKATKLEFEFNFTQNIIESATGIRTRLFRVPFWGAENQISLNSLSLVTFALDKGYVISAPTLDSYDYKASSAKAIVANSTVDEGKSVVLLLHDGGGNREKTIAALPSIIKFYKDHNYTFTTVSGLVNTPTSLDSTLVGSVSSNVLVLGYKFLKDLPLFLNPIFILGLVFTIAYSGSIIFLSIVQIIRSKKFKAALKKNFQPKVTVLIPAYNEEEVIAGSIKSILRSNYKNYQLLVIDDGSTDKTLKIARSFEKDQRVKVFHKENGGKYSALNYGLKYVDTKIYISLDADTQILPATLKNLVRFFQSKEIGAVAGNVKVGNKKNPLTLLQSIEYIMNLNLERNAYSLLNSILVVPGALGAWRTNFVKKVGGYSGKTLTEDAELTLRLLREGYKLVYDKDSLAYTEVPENTSQLIKQRFRWTFGIFQTFFIHKDMLFKKKYGILGIITLPFTVFIQIPIMLLTPLMDFFAIYYFLFISAKIVILYLALYLLIRTILAIVAFLVSKELPWPLIFIPYQRIFYQPILYIPLYQAFVSIFKGRQVGWKKLEHNGSVSIKPLSTTPS